MLAFMKRMLRQAPRRTATVAPAPTRQALSPAPAPAPGPAINLDLSRAMARDDEYILLAHGDEDRVLHAWRPFLRRLDPHGRRVLAHVVQDQDGKACLLGSLGVKQHWCGTESRLERSAFVKAWKYAPDQPHTGANRLARHVLGTEAHRTQQERLLRHISQQPGHLVWDSTSNNSSSSAEDLPITTSSKPVGVVFELIFKLQPIKCHVGSELIGQDSWSSLRGLYVHWIVAPGSVALVLSSTLEPTMRILRGMRVLPHRHVDASAHWLLNLLQACPRTESRPPAASMLWGPGTELYERYTTSAACRLDDTLAMLARTADSNTNNALHALINAPLLWGEATADCLPGELRHTHSTPEHPLNDLAVQILDLLTTGPAGMGLRSWLAAGTVPPPA